MVNISNLGDIIRWPILMIGKIIYFILDNLIPIIIIVGSIWFLYWIFNSGVVRRIVEAIESRKQKNEVVYQTETSFNKQNGI